MTNPNIFILSADSLRLDRTLDGETMPFHEALQDDATHFTNFVSNGPFTPSSMPTMHTSRYASSVNGVGIPENDGVVTIAEALSDEGYKTGFWSDNKFTGDGYNYDRGFDVHEGYTKDIKDSIRNVIDEDGALFKILEFGYMNVFQKLKNSTGESHYYATAEDLNANATEWLDTLDPEVDDVFTWLHYMDSHHPYEPDTEFMPYDELETVTNRTDANNMVRRLVQSDGKNGTEAELRDARRLYDAECEYMDSQIDAFVTYLESEGWLTDDDILVLTSDHGEVLTDWERWDCFGHENLFLEEGIRIPFIIKHGNIPNTRVTGQASLVDMVPTLLELADIEIPDEFMMGESLVPMINGTEDGREQVYLDGTLDYHGIRDVDTRKVFNCETTGPADYTQTEYVPTNPSSADTILGTPEDDLRDSIRDNETDCREMAEDTDGIDPDSIQVKQHMKDLGYLE